MSSDLSYHSNATSPLSEWLLLPKYQSVDQVSRKREDSVFLPWWSAVSTHVKAHAWPYVSQYEKSFSSCELTFSNRNIFKPVWSNLNLDRTTSPILFIPLILCAVFCVLDMISPYCPHPIFPTIVPILSFWLVLYLHLFQTICWICLSYLSFS